MLLRRRRWDWVAYVDETFNQDAYWIGCVVVNVADIRVVQTRLDEVVEHWGDEWGFESRSELHGGDLWHGSGPFTELPPGVRRAIYDDALDALVAVQPMIFMRGVARKALSLHPHRLAWRYAIESVDEGMERLGGTALVVADELAEMERPLSSDIVEYIESTTGGYRARKIERVLPDLRFVPSHENRLLQAADLVAFLHQRRRNVQRERHTRSQSAREAHWATILPWIRVDRLWTPR